jgi:hypothetical protein
MHGWKERMQWNGMEWNEELVCNEYIVVQCMRCYTTKGTSSSIAMMSKMNFEIILASLDQYG